MISQSLQQQSGVYTPVYRPTTNPYDANEGRRHF